ncbi:MAG: hypothetical protein JWM05_3592 [Acidimicrobiales bacterium]|nr:hypothetical protein [Acidimicrobiales bacterium]
MRRMSETPAADSPRVPTPRDRLSAPQARRIALAAQGFADPRPTGRIDRRHGRKVFDLVGLIQIDSVNVLVRSQELPLFARLGPHRRDLIPQLVESGELFEYWGHEASHLPVGLHPLLRWRMDAAFRGETWGGVAAIWRDDPGYVAAVLDEVRDNGPITTSMLSDPGHRSEGMWGWNRGKRALEFLFWTGQISARRDAGFQRWYDMPERILPADVLATPTPGEADAQRELLAIAGRSLGVATARDLADYFRINVPKARPLVADLVEAGRLVPVAVQGWGEPAYLHPDARLPRWVRARALLSPFDSLVWERARTERLWGFRYRIEIYVPKPQRVHGYYVLPFLLGDRLVARVDLKSDRQAGVLRVQAAYGEPGIDEALVASELLAELTELATWLDLKAVAVVGRGDLSAALTAAIGTQA